MTTPAISSASHLMPSNLIRSIYNIFNRQILSTTPETETNTTTLEMVTTRGQSEAKAALLRDRSTDIEPIDPAASSGSSKRRRNLQSTHDLASDDNEGHGADEEGDDEDDETIETPTKKKQKTLPTRNKDEDHFRSHSHFEIVIPVKTIAEMERTTPVTVKQKENSQEDGGSAGENTAFAVDHPEENGLPGEIWDLDKPTRQIAEDEPIPRRTSDKEVQLLHGKVPKQDETSVLSPLAATANSNSGEPKHKRFGSEEPLAGGLQEVPAEARQQVQDEGESSDDDAPEVVARPDAQEKVRQAAKNAAKAVEERDVIIRQKRKAQDLRLKSQAKAAGKKRKHREYVDTGPVASHPMNQEGDKRYPKDITISENDPKGLASLADPLSRTSKAKLPQFLPLEYLDDDIPSSTISNNIPTMQKPIARGKKTKFFDSDPKKSKDLVRGSTTYRIAEAKPDGLLAPKVNKIARAVKEGWLRGRVGKRGRMARRPINKGFLVKK